MCRVLLGTHLVLSMLAALVICVVGCAPGAVNTCCICHCVGAGHAHGAVTACGTCHMCSLLCVCVVVSVMHTMGKSISRSPHPNS